MSQQATLPEELEIGCSVESMKIGQSGYIKCSTMEVDGQRRCWLRADQIVARKYSNDFRVGITRTEYGYLVLTSSIHTWHASDDRLYSALQEWLPVAEIHIWEPA